LIERDEMRETTTADGAQAAGGEIGRRAPPRSGFRHRLADAVLKISGWTPEGDPPDVDQYVVVAAPHTSWWDGFWMIAFAWYWGLDVHWLVKSDVAPPPIRRLLRAIGAVPVDRSAPRGLVGELAREFREQARLIVSIPPEGTRARGEYWKSGFYQVALQAGVPICLSYLDYGRNRGGFGLCLRPSGDVKADMDRIREFYREVQARYPDQFTPPRLREEDAPPPEK
jgi:1-acyl-sn-glycerol-3-phosphate acyltransferase